MAMLSVGLFENRLRGWSPSPWLLLQQIFKTLTVVTILAGSGSLLWSLRADRSAIRVPQTRAGEPSLDSRSWTHYAAVIAKHDLFKLAPPPVIVKAVKPAPPPKPTLTELAADLMLVGVLNNGEQAAIQSKKSKETLYLSVGQQIAGITISAIEGNTVKLSYDGQTMDLSL